MKILWAKSYSEWVRYLACSNTAAQNVTRLCLENGLGNVRRDNAPGGCVQEEE